MSTTEKLYDLSIVESISGGDKEFIKKMVLLFIDTMPQSISDLQNSLQQENWEMVGKYAHKMKSTIDSMGIASLQQDIRTVETSGKNKTNLEAVPTLIARIAEVLGQCIVQLKNDYPS